MSYLFSSESVSEGHPDKVADQISDAILDQFLAYDDHARVAVETLVTTGQVVIAGEVRSSEYIDLQTIARRTIKRIGYTKSEYQFDGDSCGILNAIHEQSDDINRGVDNGDEEGQGAGDQGMMFGYACNETENYMPVTLDLAQLIMRVLADIRKEGKVMTYLRPDAKSQVTVEYAYETIKANWKAVYTISDDGKVRIENTFTSQLEEPKDERRGRRPSTDGNWIPRVGMSMQLPVSFDNLTYYGCGPYENYVDRRSSTFVDEYETQVSDMFVPYIRPEENEHRTNVRWLALSGKGKGLLNFDRIWFADARKCLEIVKRLDMFDQILFKGYVRERGNRLLDLFAAYPQAWFMPICKTSANYPIAVAGCEKHGVKMRGVEVLFRSEDDLFAQPEFVKKERKEGRFVWVNSIHLDGRPDMCAEHGDNYAIFDDPDKHWGFLLDRGYRVIQTDWPVELNRWLDTKF